MNLSEICFLWPDLNPKLFKEKARNFSHGKVSASLKAAQTDVEGGPQKDCHHQTWPLFSPIFGCSWLQFWSYFICHPHKQLLNSKIRSPKSMTSVSISHFISYHFKFHFQVFMPHTVGALKLLPRLLKKFCWNCFCCNRYARILQCSNLAGFYIFQNES